MAIVGRFGRPGTVRSARCTVAEDVGDFVYIIDEPLNGLDQVRKADPANYNKLPAVGVIISKQSSDFCRVQWSGETPAIFSGLSPGEIYFLGSDSTIAEVPPVPAGGDYAFVQPVGFATSEERAYIKTENTITKRIS
jgi:hypothetical protein